MKTNSQLPVFPKTDKRLLGTWKSDRARTFQDWSWTKKQSPQKRARFKSLFGKLEVTYTRTKVISKLGNGKWEQSQRYAVLGTDEKSVVIVQYGQHTIKNRHRYEPENLKAVDEFWGLKPTLVPIHFDKNHYWISLGTGRNREFFRKISPGK